MMCSAVVVRDDQMMSSVARGVRLWTYDPIETGRPNRIILLDLIERDVSI